MTNERAVTAIRKATTEAEKKRYDIQRMADNDATMHKFSELFKRTCLSDARSLQQVLLSRVNPVGRREAPSALESGNVITPYSFEEVAGYLESLANSL